MQDNQAVTLHLPRTLRIGRLVAFFFGAVNGLAYGCLRRQRSIVDWWCTAPPGLYSANQQEFYMSEAKPQGISTKTKKHRMFMNDRGMAITDRQGKLRLVIGKLEDSNPIIRAGNKSNFQQWAQSAGR